MTPRASGAGISPDNPAGCSAHELPLLAATTAAASTSSYSLDGVSGGERAVVNVVVTAAAPEAPASEDAPDSVAGAAGDARPPKEKDEADDIAMQSNGVSAQQCAIAEDNLHDLRC